MHPKTIEDLTPEQREEFKSMTPEQVAASLAFDADKYGRTTMSVEDFATGLVRAGVADYDEQTDELCLAYQPFALALLVWADEANMLDTYEVVDVPTSRAVHHGPLGLSIVLDDAIDPESRMDALDIEQVHPERLAAALVQAGLARYEQYGDAISFEAEPFSVALVRWAVEAQAHRAEAEREDQPA